MNKSLSHLEKARANLSRGIDFYHKGNFQAAEAFFLKSLELVPENAPALMSLSAVQARLGKLNDAEKSAKMAISKKGNFVEAWSNLAAVLLALGRTEEALTACERALVYDPECSDGWINKARALARLKQYKEAVETCDHVLKKNPRNRVDALYIKSFALKQLGEGIKAKFVHENAVLLNRRLTPIISSEFRSTQNYRALIISGNRILESVLSTLDEHHRSGNFPAQLSRIFLDTVHFSFVMAKDLCNPEVREKLPHFDFVINNNTNAEIILAEGDLSEFTDACDSLGTYVVNHPRTVLLSSRISSAELIRGLPGVIVPHTKLFEFRNKTINSLTNEIEGEFDYPLITRPLTSQQGEGMFLVRTQEELTKIISTQFSGQEFLITKFIDSRGGRKYFRKIRAAFVMDEIVIVRVDFDSNWNIHGRKSDERAAFYLANSYLLDEEKKICATPEIKLGLSAMQALQKIRGSIPLDVGGIDFDVDSEGSIVFYELNASMNLFSTAKPEVDHPSEPQNRLKMIFENYFASLVKDTFVER